MTNALPFIGAKRTNFWQRMWPCAVSGKLVECEPS
jgi:hypothetical protein